MNDEFEDQAINQIVDSANNDALIIFVGAGISTESGLPSWNDLISEMKKELTLDEGMNDNLKIAQFYYNTWGQQRYIQKIVDIFKEYKYAKPNKIHNQIFKIKPRHLITTNYDTLLEDRMNLGMTKYDVIKSDEDIPYSDSKHYLIKMHGDFSKKNMVLKEDDYLDYENNFYMVSTLIKSLIMNNTLLFIGYSLGDSTFNSIFRLIQNNFGDNAKKAYFYTPNKPQQPVIDYYKKKGIYVISDEEKVEYKQLGRATEEFITKISDKINYKANNEKELWDKISFLNQLNYVESGDVINDNEILGSVWLKNPDEYLWIMDQNEQNTFEISNDSEVFKFLNKKTTINKFLNVEFNSHELKRNEILEPAFKLYKERRYGEAQKEFREIANDSYKNGKYTEFLIAEFNVLHITPILNYENEPKLSIPVYGNEEFDNVVKEMTESSEPNQKGIASFLKENVFNFKFVYRKMNTIMKLLNDLMNEHDYHINGGWSVNRTLFDFEYEFHSFMNFIEYNCICIDQYKEFKLIIDKYFEGLLLSFDNSTIPSEKNLFIDGTSSSITELELIDLKLVLPYINFKMIPVYMNTYSIEKIKISAESYEYINSRILILCEENKNSIKNIFNYTLLNNYIELLSIVHIDDLDNIINVLQNYPMYPNSNSGKSIKIILNILCENKKLLSDKSKNKLLKIVKDKLNVIISKKYKTHFENFHFFVLLLKIIEDSKINIENISIKKFSDDLILINNNGKNISDIESYSKFITSFYNFLDESDRVLIDCILNKYSELSKDKIKNSFIIEMIENKVSSFPKLKQFIFESIIKKIKKESLQDAQIKSYPSPVMEPLANLYNLEEQGYFDLNSIRNAGIDDLIIGKYPEIDWEWFELKNDETIVRLLKNRTFAVLSEQFGKTDGDKKIINDWLIKQFNNENFRQIKNSLPNG